MRADHSRWQRVIEIMLSNKNLKHLRRRIAIGVGGKKCAIAQMPAAANHRQVHTHPPTCLGHHNDIRVALIAVLHGLLVQYLGQCAHLVAQQRGLFKLKGLRGGEHTRLDIAHDLLGFTV